MLKKMDLNTKTLTLYHGSKGGIVGIPKPNSRDTCDFGAGLYLSDNELQPKNLIANAKYINRRFYCVTLNMEGLTVLDLCEEKQLWCLFIAYNRQLLTLKESPKLIELFERFNREYDVIVGPIADDKMTLVIDQFFNNLITNEALYNAMSFLNLGKQYVLKTQKACNAAMFDIGTQLSDIELQNMQNETRKREQSMQVRLNSVLGQYRRSGKYFDELIKETGGV